MRFRTGNADGHYGRHGPGAGAGILIRNAESLETFGKVNTLIVDKTGTLTEGKPRLASVLPQSRISKAELLQLVVSLERSSEHPLAAAIVKEAEVRKLTHTDVQGFSSVTGKGVTGSVSGKRVIVGNMDMFRGWALTRQHRCSPKPKL